MKEKFKPSVPKNILIFTSGLMWLIVGSILISMAYKWLNNINTNLYLYIFPGIAIAMLSHHFGFLNIANKNISRILNLKDKTCFFAFVSWKSYSLILVMIAMGITLRHSVLPKQYLSIIYIGIGLGLFLSSIRYFRIFFKELLKK